MKKSVRKPINKQSKPIKVDAKGIDKESKRKNNIIYLKQRYSFHYKKGNWEKENEYNEYSIENFQTNLKDWIEKKELSKLNNKNIFGFDKPKKLKYG